MTKIAVHKFQGLDALRGIAAIMVVLQHFWEMNHPANLRFKPWLFFCAGHEAVILFFVLSGFVLSHQLRDFKFNSYPQYVKKRFLRIYPLYYVTIIFSACMLYYISHYHPSRLDHYGLTNWFYVWSRTHFDTNLFFASLTLISHQGNSLNGVCWTLFYEVWISLFFPFLLYGLFRSHTLLNIFVVSCWLALSYYLRSITLWLDNPWGAIIYYSWYFIFGMFLYTYLNQLKILTSNGFILIAIILYFSNYWLFGKITSRSSHELIIACGSSLFILASVHNDLLKKILSFRPFQFYGRISYSVYLLHLPILDIFSYLFLAKYSVIQIKFATFGCVTILATISYYIVELPFINLARKYSGK